MLSRFGKKKPKSLLQLNKTKSKMYYEYDLCSNDEMKRDSSINLWPSVERLASKCAVVPQCPWELGSRTPEDNQSPQMLKFLV